MPTKNPLPPKENALFKRILKCYEQKQYKNGLKFCKQILTNPKFSEHGETLAMKGLTLNCMGRKDEAYDYVRKGLRNDLTSHVCWHVYGLLQRSDRKYDEAIKCYRNALKWDKDNLQILRDLSLLQIQMRDLDGYKDTRYQLLCLRPAQRASWIGYAMAFHLIKDYEMAFSVLEEFRKTQQPKPYDYEHSEMLLYENMLLVEWGKYERALEHLNEYDKQIVDRLVFQETKGSLLLKLERYKEAEVVYWDLIDRNPENHAYYTGLEQAMQSSSVEQRLEIYVKIQKMKPWAMCPRRLPMNFTSGDIFRKYADELLRSSIRKGMQPLFVLLRELYKDSEKVSIIEDLVLGYEKNLHERCRLTANENDKKEDPTTELYTWFFLAQHYDYTRQYTKALDYIEKCIQHTGTFIEAHAIKGQIYKHAGDITSAVCELDETQSLDTADRCMNCQCARYMLNANMVKEAELMCSKFTREGVSAMDNLNEMQCFWFQVGCARAYQRLNKYGEALKKCHEIDRHFTEIIEDQFDFHTYCMRKMTLRAYVELLRLEDKLRGHKFYFQAAKVAIDIYLRLYDHPLKEGEDENHVDQENLSPSELKKLKNKQRKKARKEAQQKEREKQEEQGKQQHQKAKNPDVDQDGPKEEELVPEKLARPENPLEEAIKFLKPLQLIASDNIETHLLGFEVYYRKGKLLLMLQCLKRGQQIDPDNPHLHMCRVKFLKLVQDKSDGELSGPVGQVIKDALGNLYTTPDLQEVNSQFVASHKNSIPHTLAGARMMYYLDPSTSEQAINMATSLSDHHISATHLDCIAVLDSLHHGDLGTCQQSIVNSYTEQCRQVFPLCNAFKPPGTIKTTTNYEQININDNASMPNGDTSP